MTGKIRETLVGTRNQGGHKSKQHGVPETKNDGS